MNQPRLTRGLPLLAESTASYTTGVLTSQDKSRHLPWSEENT